MSNDNNKRTDSDSGFGGGCGRGIVGNILKTVHDTEKDRPENEQDSETGEASRGYDLRAFRSRYHE